MLASMKTPVAMHCYMFASLAFSDSCNNRITYPTIFMLGDTVATEPRNENIEQQRNK